MKKVAVIILNWNGAALLRHYLPTVIAGTDDAIADIFVADNGSTDQSVEVLQKEFPGVKVLKFDENHGFAQGYNLAIGQTMYPYTVLLNSDVRTPQCWLNPLFEYIPIESQIERFQDGYYDAIAISTSEASSVAGVGMLAEGEVGGEIVVGEEADDIAYGEGDVDIYPVLQQPVDGIVDGDGQDTDDAEAENLAEDFATEQFVEFHGAKVAQF